MSKQDFYDKVQEILHGHFHHILLDTQAGSNFMWKGQHKHTKARRQGLVEAGGWVPQLRYLVLARMGRNVCPDTLSWDVQMDIPHLENDLTVDR